MDIDLILEELKKDGWWLENHFYNESKDFLQAVVNQTEKQLMLGGVGKSFYCLGDSFGESGKCDKQCDDCRAKILKQ